MVAAEKQTEMSIWKFALPLKGLVCVEMPKGADLLSVDDQRGQICLWALCNTKADTVKRWFRIIGTGHQIDSEVGKFVATVQQDSFVWHVFEAA